MTLILVLGDSIDTRLLVNAIRKHEATRLVWPKPATVLVQAGDFIDQLNDIDLPAPLLFDGIDSHRHPHRGKRRRQWR